MIVGIPGMVTSTAQVATSEHSVVRHRPALVKQSRCLAWARKRFIEPVKMAIDTFPLSSMPSRSAWK
jgi:hypothetical protein